MSQVMTAMCMILMHTCDAALLLTPVQCWEPWDAFKWDNVTCMAATWKILDAHNIHSYHEDFHWHAAGGHLYALLGKDPHHNLWWNKAEELEGLVDWSYGGQKAVD